MESIILIGILYLMYIMDKQRKELKAIREGAQGRSVKAYTMDDYARKHNNTQSYRKKGM